LESFSTDSEKNCRLDCQPGEALPEQTSRINRVRI